MSADPSNVSSNVPSAVGERSFATTEWSVVLAAGDAGRHDARIALARLCETYWYPLYAYVRRRVRTVHDAQDLTQAFFCHLLEKQSLARADRRRGRFRTFLITALTNFLSNEWDRKTRQKRGGGRPALSLDFDSGEARYRIEPSHELTAERLYERRWVLTVLDHVLERLRVELAEAGKHMHFELLKGALVGESTGADYERAAQALGISPAAAKQAAYRLRKRYRRLFREEIARTVANERDVDDEMERLLTSLDG
jgi:RNA polymerase sigma-70 factor (ECF subfamily)